MAAYTVKYTNRNISSGVVMHGPSKEEALLAFEAWTANRNMDATIDSVEQLDDLNQRIYDAFRSDNASTIGD